MHFKENGQYLATEPVLTQKKPSSFLQMSSRDSSTPAGVRAPWSFLSCLF